jgi:hypothetical protein
MLAYIFWHWPRRDVNLVAYEARLRAFHHALGADAPAGLQRSLVWRVDGAPWLPPGPAYEDWYLLEDSGALDELNAAAMSGRAGRAHDPAAALAAGGTAGLYRPVRPGEVEIRGSSACWFPKPDGMIYADVYKTLVESPGGVWVRMMVLGPAPEFCLLGDGAPDLPTEWEGIVVNRRAIWP